MDVEAINNAGKVVSQPSASGQVSRVNIEERVEFITNKMQNTEQSKEKQDGKEKQLSESTVRETVSNVNNRMTSTRCEFSYHKGTNRVSIKVIDKDSDEVVREIPPEKSLEMLQKMWELAGLFVDKRK